MTATDIQNWLGEISAQSALPGICYFLFFTSKWKKPITWLFILLVASWLADNLSILELKTDNPNTHPVSQTWMMLNYLVQGVLFMKLFPRLKPVISILIAIFILSCVISFGWFYSFTESNTFMAFYATATSILLCILCYYCVLKGQLIRDRLSTSPVFLFISATFLYNCVVAFFFLTMNYLVFQKNVSFEIMVPLMMLNVVANTAKNIIFFFVIVLIGKGHYFGQLT